MKLLLGKERVIVQGIRPEEKLWGPYQFPQSFDLGDRLVVSVHVEEDHIKTFGLPQRWFESRDRGESWQEVDPSVAGECGLKLSNGDRIYFPPESGIDLSDYQFASYHSLTPGYDFSKQAEEGIIPIQDGVTAWFTGTVIRAYDADRLPPSLAKKEWKMLRLRAGESEPVIEYAKLDWPKLTRVVHQNGKGAPILKPIFPRGTPKIGPDGAIWITCYSGEGHLDPETGRYSPYYSAQIFRSEDLGKSFQLRSNMEYPADGSDIYPYQSGGFSDSDIAFMPDGSIVWFMRSAWMASTGYEWSPMYMARSEDMGLTWTKPIPFAPVGVFPRTCQLGCGATLVCYARPGIYVRGCNDGKGIDWCEPLEVMTNGDRSHLSNIKIENPKFHEWDGAGNNPTILATGYNTALLFYSDFYYPDAEGVKRKSILCVPIIVEE
jgi:hypothetical protein